MTQKPPLDREDPLINNKRGRQVPYGAHDSVLMEGGLISSREELIGYTKKTLLNSIKEDGHLRSWGI